MRVGVVFDVTFNGIDALQICEIVGRNPRYRRPLGTADQWIAQEICIGWLHGFPMFRHGILQMLAVRLAPQCDDCQRMLGERVHGEPERTGATNVFLSSRVEELEMQGKKTHEQQLRMLEKKDDMPDPRQPARDTEPAHIAARSKRQSEFDVSRSGMNQESDDNKHNQRGQSGHKPQQHSPAEEKN